MIIVGFPYTSISEGIATEREGEVRWWLWALWSHVANDISSVLMCVCVYMIVCQGLLWVFLAEFYQLWVWSRWHCEVVVGLPIYMYIYMLSCLLMPKTATLAQTAWLHIIVRHVAFRFGLWKVFRINSIGCIGFVYSYAILIILWNYVGYWYLFPYCISNFK